MWVQYDLLTMPTSFNNANIRKLLEARPRQAILLLYEEYYYQLIWIAYRHTHNRQDSDDVIQEVFVDLFKRHKQISRMSDEPIVNYLIKAVRNRAISQYRQKMRLSMRETQYYHAHGKTGDEYAPDRDLISNERAASLSLVVARLSDREKESFLMQLEGVRVKDIAERLSISVKAVERNLTRAKKRLRAFLGVDF